MRELVLLFTMYNYMVQVIAGPGTDLKSFWSYNGLALSEVPWNSVTNRYVNCLVRFILVIKTLKTIIKFKNIHIFDVQPSVYIYNVTTKILQQN